MFGFDRDFLEKLVSRDKESFNVFYVKSVDVFYRYVKANYFVADADAHDIISDFYVKLWHSLPQCDLDSNFQAFVWVMFKNLLKDYFKKAKGASFSDMDTEATFFEDSLSSDDDVSSLFEKDFQYDRILSGMKELDDMSREVIMLKYMEERSTSDIAILCDLTEEVVRQRLSRALKKLKTLLK